MNHITFDDGALESAISAIFRHDYKIREQVTRIVSEKIERMVADLFKQHTEEITKTIKECAEKCFAPENMQAIANRMCLRVMREIGIDVIDQDITDDDDNDVFR